MQKWRRLFPQFRKNAKNTSRNVWRAQAQQLLLGAFAMLLHIAKVQAKRQGSKTSLCMRCDAAQEFA